MTEAQFHGVAVWTVIALSIITFAYLCAYAYLRRGAAPYGRHYAGAGWGPHIPNVVGWVIMELPSTAAFLIVYVNGQAAEQLVPLIFLALWQSHYLHRNFVYPLRMRTKGKKIPVLVVGLGFLFNSLNAYINARFVSSIGEYGADWLWDPRFLAGAVLFLLGMAVNIHSDNLLLKLRNSGAAKYAVPQGGLFRYISCPNYLGEIIEWAGWALATWSLAGLAFFLYTLANLAPRAHSNHEWCRKHLADYPKHRKALIPGIF